MDRLLQWRRLPYAVATAAVIMLAGLAALQYRWIGEIATAERERMRSRLDASVGRFQKRFTESVSTPLAVAATMPGEDLPAAISRWYSSARDAHVVRTIYEVSPEGTLSRFDPAQHGFVREEWPDRLSRLRERIANHGPGRPPIDENLPAVALPRIAVPPPAPGGPGERGRLVFEFRTSQPLGWTIIEYDGNYLTSTVLPVLVSSEFADEWPSDTAVRIVSADNPSQVIYTNAPQLGAAFFALPDATGPILDIGAPTMLRQPGPPHLEGEPGRVAVFYHTQMTGPWRLEVKMRAGSLDAVVAHTRLHNLMLSGAVLLLIGLVTAVLFVATRRAQAYAQAQSELVAGVSHELRTPLAVICSAAENLSDGIVSKEEAVRRYGSVIGREGRRLTGIVEQVLRFAGIQSGRTALDFEPVEVDRIISGALAGCEADIAASNVNVRTDIEPSLTPALADPVALTQCIRNLIDNAVRYGGKGGEVTIGARDTGDSVEITVADRGPGIEPSEFDRIFEPFYRGRRALRDQTRGFGLGLALVKRLMDAHSGSVEAANLPNGGALFTLRVPAAPKPAASLATAEVTGV